MGKVLVGGIVGAIILFTWGFVSHMVLPIGMMGFSKPMNSEATLSAIGTGVGGSGLFFLPYIDPESSEEEMTAAMARFEGGASAFVVYNAGGLEMMSTRQLGTQFFSGLIATLIAAFLLSHSRASYGGRVVFVTLLGLFAWAAVHVPHWNWYRFPQDWAVGGLLDQGLGFFVTGLIMAAIVKPGEAAA